MGRAVRRDAGRGGQLGQGQSRRAARYRRGLLRLDDRVSTVLRIRGGIAKQSPRRARSSCTSATRWSRSAPQPDTARQTNIEPSCRGRPPPLTGTSLGACVRRARARTGPASTPMLICRPAWSTFMRQRLHWNVLYALEHDDLRRAPTASFRPRATLQRTLITLDRDYLDDRRYPPDRSGRRGSWRRRPTRAGSRKCAELDARVLHRTRGQLPPPRRKLRWTSPKAATPRR